MQDKFNSFKDNGQDIVPALASDWEFSISNASGNNQISISSTQLDQRFSIYIESFFTSLERLSIHSIGNKLQGSFIFDRYRAIFSEEEYFQWEDQLESNSLNEIKKKDLIPGQGYLDENGDMVYYLGFRFVSTLKEPLYKIRNYGITPNSISKVTKKYFFISQKDEAVLINNNFNRKIIDIVDKKIKNQDVLLKTYYENRFNIVQFSEEKISNPIYIIARKRLKLSVDS